MKKICLSSFCLLWILAGCTSSKITATWKAPGTMPRQYNKIMVVGLIRDADRSIQVKMEDHFTADLKSLGYNAVSSYREYGPKAFENMDTATAISKLKNSGVDAVITIVMLDKHKESKYVPGNAYYSPYSYYSNNFWGYRTTIFQRIYEPGYYLTSIDYFWESNFYDMSDRGLIYSAQTRSFDPLNSELLGHEYGLLIVKNLVKEHILNQQLVTGTEP